jgi:hypothetical protein
LKKRVEFTGRDILPLKEGLDAIAPQRSLSPLWFALFLTIPAVVFFTVRAVMQITRKDDSPGRIMADRARQALKAAAAGDSPDADFLSALYRALVSAILGRRGVTGTSLTWSEASDQLMSKSDGLRMMPPLPHSCWRRSKASTTRVAGLTTKNGPTCWTGPVRRCGG